MSCHNCRATDGNCIYPYKSERPYFRKGNALICREDAMLPSNYSPDESVYTHCIICGDKAGRDPAPFDEEGGVYIVPDYDWTGATFDDMPPAMPQVYVAAIIHPKIDYPLTKVGMSRGPAERAASLRHEWSRAGYPYTDVKMLLTIATTRAEEIEQEAIKEMSEHWAGGEYFIACPSKAIGIVTALVSKTWEELA